MDMDNNQQRFNIQIVMHDFELIMSGNKTEPLHT